MLLFLLALGLVENIPAEKSGREPVDGGFDATQGRLNEKYSLPKYTACIFSVRLSLIRAEMRVLACLTMAAIATSPSERKLEEE